MKLELSDDERAFRDEMREFFTTKVSEDIRRTVAEGCELSHDQYVESMRTLNAAEQRPDRPQGRVRRRVLQ